MLFFLTNANNNPQGIPDISYVSSEKDFRVISEAKTGKLQDFLIKLSSFPNGKYTKIARGSFLRNQFKCGVRIPKLASWEKTEKEIINSSDACDGTDKYSIHIMLIMIRNFKHEQRECVLVLYCKNCYQEKNTNKYKHYFP